MTRGTSPGLLFARLQLRLPGARAILFAPPRSSTTAWPLARSVAEYAADAMAGVTLTQVTADEAGESDAAGSKEALTTRSIPGIAFATVERAREEIEGQSGLAILVSGGLLDAPSALILAAVVDGIVVVADRGKTSKADLSQVREEMERIGGRIAGAVLQG